MGTIGAKGRLSIPVAYKIVLPFMLLILVLGPLVTWVGGEQVGAQSAAALDTVAIRDEYSVGAMFDIFEQRQLANLRALTTTDKLAAAVASGDRTVLRASLLPVLALQLPDPLQATVVSSDGRELLSLRADAAAPTVCICISGRDLSSWRRVEDVLQGRQDAVGAKYAGVQLDGIDPIFYTVGPISGPSGVVGAMLVSEPLASLVAQIGTQDGVEVAFFLPDGTRLSETAGFPDLGSALDAAARKRVASGGGRFAPPRPGANSPQLFFVPWKIRGASVGYAAFAVQPGVISPAGMQAPVGLVLIFGIALGAALLVGVLITRSITRPLSLLVQATAAVAAGNLDQRAKIDSTDEIGRLAAAFNDMTASLQEQTHRLEESSEATVQTLAAAIDARDAYTHGHSLRVAAYSLELARAAGLTVAEQELVRRGCLVHDLGKIGVPDHILRKPGRLEVHEEAIMRRHPLVGHDMLRRLLWPQEILQIVLHHHERWDGSGYPYGLAGEAIPAASRLVALADALDAMTSHRPYRPAMSFAVAAAEIERASGAHFDPVVVHAFVRAHDAIRALVASSDVPSSPRLQVVG